MGEKERIDKSFYFFYNANGTSTVVYLLTDVITLDTIVGFCTGFFNTFSDHAPLAFTIYIDLMTERCIHSEKFTK